MAQNEDILEGLFKNTKISIYDATDSAKDNRKNTYEFFKEITKGIEPTGSYSAKMVYVYEFRDENNNKVAAYVGLTDKEEVRHKEHMTGVTREGKDIKTAVTKFIEENPNLYGMDYRHSKQGRYRCTDHA